MEVQKLKEEIRRLRQYTDPKLYDSYCLLKNQLEEEQEKRKKAEEERRVMEEQLESLRAKHNDAMATYETRMARYKSQFSKKLTVMKEENDLLTYQNLACQLSKADSISKLAHAKNIILESETELRRTQLLLEQAKIRIATFCLKSKKEKLEKRMTERRCDRLYHKLTDVASFSDSLLRACAMPLRAKAARLGDLYLSSKKDYLIMKSQAAIFKRHILDQGGRISELYATNTELDKKLKTVEEENSSVLTALKNKENEHSATVTLLQNEKNALQVDLTQLKKEYNQLSEKGGNASNIVKYDTSFKKELVALKEKVTSVYDKENSILEQQLSTIRQECKKIFEAESEKEKKRRASGEASLKSEVRQLRKQMQILCNSSAINRSLRGNNNAEESFLEDIDNEEVPDLEDEVEDEVYKEFEASSDDTEYDSSDGEENQAPVRTQSTTRTKNVTAKTISTRKRSQRGRTRSERGKSDASFLSLKDEESETANKENVTKNAKLQKSGKKRQNQKNKAGSSLFSNFMDQGNFSIPKVKT